MLSRDWLSRAAVLASLLAAPAAHSAEMPANLVFLRGAITAIDATHVQIKTRDGRTQDVKLAPNWILQVTKPISANQIKSGSFIGTAEMPQANGSGRSLEVHVFPAGMKPGEGHYSWGLKKGSMMTNGTVGKVTASGNGRAFDVSYPTGTRHIVVPPKTPIVQIVPGGRELAKPGARVFVAAVPTAGGLATQAIQVGDNGSAPPM